MRSENDYVKGRPPLPIIYNQDRGFVEAHAELLNDAILALAESLGPKVIFDRDTVIAYLLACTRLNVPLSKSIELLLSASKLNQDPVFWLNNVEKLSKP